MLRTETGTTPPQSSLLQRRRVHEGVEGVGAEVRVGVDGGVDGVKVHRMGMSLMYNKIQSKLPVGLQRLLSSRILQSDLQ